MLFQKSNFINGESAQKKFIFWGILNNTSVVADRGIDRPLPAAGALVHDTCVTRLRVLLHVALPGDLLLIVEVHANLP